MQVSRARVTLLGAILGLAWGAGLRGWMAVFTWSGTFVAILLPSTLVGAALGWAEHARRTGGRGAWRWTALTPLLFVVMSALVQDNLVPRLVRTGIGGAQIGIALIGIIGGYALSGRGPRWARLVSRAIMAASVVAAVPAFGSGFGPRLAPTAPAGAFALLTFVVFSGLLAGACAIPHLPAQHAIAASNSRPQLAHPAQGGST